MMRTVSIPEERIAVLIGKNGKTKRDIEQNTATKISINREISISGSAVDCMAAENIVVAIGRGFAPNKALMLADDDYYMIIVELSQNYKALRRIRARLIGERGKSRRSLEHITKCFISVYGKTVSIIGYSDDVSIAKGAIERLIKGASHRSVWKFISDSYERERNGERDGERK